MKKYKASGNKAKEVKDGANGIKRHLKIICNACKTINSAILLFYIKTGVLQTEVETNKYTTAVTLHGNLR